MLFPVAWLETLGPSPVPSISWIGMAILVALVIVAAVVGIRIVQSGESE